MDEGDVIWESPPASRRGSRWNDVFHELSQHPDEWAKIFEGPSRTAYSTAGRLRTKADALYGVKVIEIISRGIGERGSGQAGVWAIYHSDRPDVPTKEFIEDYPNHDPDVWEETPSYPLDDARPTVHVEDNEIYEPSGNPFSD